MIGAIGCLILAFCPRYWLAGLLALIGGALNFYLVADNAPYLPSATVSSLRDDATTLTVFFGLLGFGIVFVRKMVREMRRKTETRLAVILAQAKAREGNPEG